MEEESRILKDESTPIVDFRQPRWELNEMGTAFGSEISVIFSCGGKQQLWLVEQKSKHSFFAATAI